MKLDSSKTPGFDCPRGNCRSKGCPGGDLGGGSHGVHGEEWCYWVAADDGLTALSLMVYTDIFPATVPKDTSPRGNRPLSERRHGVDITLHVGFPTTPEEVTRFDLDGKGRPCCFLASPMADCSRTSALQADEFFKAFGGPEQFDQGDMFWTALKDRFAEQDAKARAERTDGTHSSCGTCGGKGYVALPRYCDVCPHALALHNPDGTCGCGSDCRPLTYDLPVRPEVK